MQRSLGLFQVNPVGLGCMPLSHGYAPFPSESTAIHYLNEAIDLGYNHLDTAALYAFGANEQLLAKALAGRRHEFVLASKCGLFGDSEGKRVLNGRPEALRATCEQSLRNLNTEVIDLYYLHRLDPDVPVEESVGTLGDIVKEGKLRSIGLSEVSADTLFKAHCEHPVTALQSEYSLWSRNPELGTLAMCQRLGITFVAFSPVGRGMLTDKPPANVFEADDVRAGMPRFNTENYPKNLQLQKSLQAIANELQITTAQLAIAWVLQQNESIITIPGTGNIEHAKDNLAAQQIQLSTDIIEKLNTLFPPNVASGDRYSANGMQEVDTENFT